MKAMVGMALALSLALVGCQGGDNQGGGGGAADNQGATVDRDRDMTPGDRGATVEQDEGGGGGTATQDRTDANRMQSNLVIAGADANEMNDNLREATKNASEARTSVVNRNWDEAKANLDELQDQLNDVAKDVHPRLQTQVSELRTLADKATASVKNRSADARQDLDKLVSRINTFTTGRIQAGGGKPAPKTEHKSGM